VLLEKTIPTQVTKESGACSWDNERAAMRPGFWTAMGCYGGLGVLALLTLEPLPRNVVWLVLAALAVKTWIARLKRNAGEE
jgi:hypothetical protein